MNEIAQVETLLKTQDKGDSMQDGSPEDLDSDIIPQMPKRNYPDPTYKSMDETPYTTLPPSRQLIDNWNDPATWELIGLGTEEPMPTQDAQNELYD